MGLIVGDRSEYERVISERDLIIFSKVSGDDNPVHMIDMEAEEYGFERRIAHGILITSFISKVIGNQMPGKGSIYMEQDVRFLNPVYIGDKVKVVVVVSEILNDKKGIYKLDTSVYVHNKKVIDGYAVVKYIGGKDGRNTTI